MDNYKLRSELRELDTYTGDEGGDDSFILPKSLRNEIENRLFEMDKVQALIHNYKEVLRDVLK